MKIDLELAKEKKFLDFSKAVKQELHNKLSNHKDIKKYVSDYDKIQAFKSKFAEITSMGKAKDNPEDKNSD